MKEIIAIPLDRWPCSIISADCYCIITSTSNGRLSCCDGLLTAPFLPKPTFPDYYEGIRSTPSLITQLWVLLGREQSSSVNLTGISRVSLVSVFRCRTHNIELQSDHTKKLKTINLSRTYDPSAGNNATFGKVSKDSVLSPQSHKIRNRLMTMINSTKYPSARCVPSLHTTWA